MMKIRQILRHIITVAAGVFVLVGIPFLRTGYFRSLISGRTDAVTSPSVIIEEPSGEYVVMINKAMHTDGKKLDDWVRFFEGGDVTYIFEDICCSVPVQDAGAVEMAQSFRSRLPENQMRIEEADVTLLLSRADEKKYDILILSKDIAEAFRADTQPSEETVRIEISGTESTESGTGSPDARSDL